MSAMFENKCWRCWPAFCKCPLPSDEVEKLKSERFLFEREMYREKRRTKEISSALINLFHTINKSRESRLIDGGLDNLPPDLFEISEQAKKAIQLINEVGCLDAMAESEIADMFEPTPPAPGTEES